MLPAEELLQRDEVAQRFAHFLSVDGDHIVVHPVVHHVVALRGHGLRNLAFVVRENQVHAAAVYVEVRAQIFASHGGALAVPAGKSVAPRRRPAHDVFGLGFLPQGEVGGVVLLLLPVQFAGRVQHVFQVAPGQFSIVVVLVVFGHVEVDGALAFVGITIVQDFLHQRDLFDDVAAGLRLDAGG